jgi:anti-sigma B factor antagonist
MSANSIKYRLPEMTTGIAVVDLDKNVLGGSEALEFTSVLEELCHLAEIKLIAVDLSKVELMNSSGLGMLVNGMNSVKKHEKKLVLVGVPQKVEKLLKMTHLDEVFKIYKDVETSSNVLD